MDLLLDSHLTPHWHFDSIRLFKWNGAKWVRFRHEPWTANRMWNVQVSTLLRRNHTLSTKMLLVICPRWWHTIWFHCICRQDKTLLIWDRKGLPSPCSMCPASNRNSEWHWHRWWSTSWLAPSGKKCYFCVKHFHEQCLGGGRHC